MKARLACAGMLLVLAGCTRSEPDTREIAVPQTRASQAGGSAAPAVSAAAAASAAPVGSAATVAPIDSAARAAAEKYVITLELVAQLFFDHAQSCDELAKALAGATRERDALRESATASAHQAASTDEALRRRLEEASRRIADGSMSCAPSKPFVRARAQLFAR